MSLSLSAAAVTRQNVQDIPRLSHAEAGALSQTAYERLLAVLETLSGDDWRQPTYCTEWTVREMVAHLAGAVAGSSSLREFMRQNLANPYIKEFDEPVDGANKLQILERADKSPAELVDEFRRMGQIAVRNRQKLPWPVRKIHLPMGSVGVRSIEYLMDTLYPRDQWMHRYDICAATGKKMVVTPQHDGRIVALVLQDVQRKLRRRLDGRTIGLRLTGAAGGAYQFGRKATPDCILEIDLLVFNLRASGRISAAEARRQTGISGNAATADWFLDNCEVMY